MLPLFAPWFTACARGIWAFLCSLVSLNWYRMVSMGDILFRLLWIKFINMLSLYVQSRTHRAHSLMSYCSFNIWPYCSEVCGYQQSPQTLTAICRNMNICGLVSGSARYGKKYLFHLIDVKVLSGWGMYWMGTGGNFRYPCPMDIYLVYKDSLGPLPKRC